MSSSSAQEQSDFLQQKSYRVATGNFLPRNQCGGFGSVHLRHNLPVSESHKIDEERLLVFY